SHAGISSITGYWAEGYWGYSYGSRALANSFPWNNPDLYVNQSPLAHADQINTPLLLLHGTDDTNVPKGESDGMYIALKLLGKDVEYVRIDGQDHHIVDHEKRIVWHNTIMSYMSKYLKEDARWWDEMYQE
ncbi:prolyl oligopeptidase family serine peptidase, partial [bacterium]|nr:prolyl oligopeptidase family serine peptidase [bacterium]